MPRSCTAGARTTRIVKRLLCRNGPCYDGGGGRSRQSAAVRVRSQRLGAGTKSPGSVGYFVIQRSLVDEHDQVHPLPVTSQELWDELDERILQRDWLHESGNYMQIRVMTIDTGSRPKPVYDFAVKHPQISYSASGAKVHAYRTVVPIKGNDDLLKIISGVSKEDASRKRQNVRIVTVGTICAKGQVYDNLRNIAPSLTGKPKPGCFHHPMYERGWLRPVVFGVPNCPSEDRRGQLC